MIKIEKRLALAVVLLVMGSGASWGHGGASGVVKERMVTMEAIGSNMKTVGKMLKTETEVDADLVMKSGSTIADHAGEALLKLFPSGSLMSPTEATEAIWTDWNLFTELANRLQISAENMTRIAADGGDKKAVASAFGKIAATCKACHADFRVKK
ncbi:MAG: cytochrome c [Roseibium sp.]